MSTTVIAPAIDHLGWAVRYVDSSRSRRGFSLIGEHTGEVLGELGFSADDIESIRRDQDV